MRIDNSDRTSTREYYSQHSEIYWSSEDEDEGDEITSEENRNNKMKSSAGDDYCKPHEISENKAMSTEDA